MLICRDISTVRVKIKLMSRRVPTRTCRPSPPPPPPRLESLSNANYMVGHRFDGVELTLDYLGK